MAGVVWTEEEASLARELRAQGKHWHIIAQSLPGRSPASVERYVKYAVGHKLDYADRVAIQSGTLLRALAVSITRYANDNAISMPEAMNRLLYAGEAR